MPSGCWPAPTARRGCGCRAPTTPTRPRAPGAPRRASARCEEQNRLLYVAMTRAEDRLYVGGWVGGEEAGPRLLVRAHRGGPATPAATPAMVRRMPRSRAAAPWRASSTSRAQLGDDGWSGDGYELTNAGSIDDARTGRAAASRRRPGCEPWARQPAPAEPDPPTPLAPSQPLPDEALREPARLQPAGAGRSATLAARPAAARAAAPSAGAAAGGARRGGAALPRAARAWT